MSTEAAREKNARLYREAVVALRGKGPMSTTDLAAAVAEAPNALTGILKQSKSFIVDERVKGKPRIVRLHPDLLRNP